MTTLKEAMALLAASDDAPALGALPPSKLGTKAHWDQVYEREVRTFEEIGDEGEVWFGEDSAEKMVDWMEEHVEAKDTSVLDVGTGNGQLLFCLSEAGYTALTGVDYSEASVQLARSIAARRELPHPVSFVVADILSSATDANQEVSTRSWGVVTDKGTYDAVCLSDETRGGKTLAQLYPASVSRLLPTGGLFLITSCNWTRAELEKAFITEETGLLYHSHVPRPSFSFGGSSGSSITTIAFVKQ